MIFYQTLPGSSFADNYHFTSLIWRNHKLPATINPAVKFEILKKLLSSDVGGPSILNNFFQIHVSQFKAYTSFKFFPFAFPPYMIMQGCIYIDWNYVLEEGILPLAYTTDHFYDAIENIDILSTDGAETDLSTLNAIFFFGAG